MFHGPPTWWQGKHTCDMVNAALGGGVRWVRVNLFEQGNAVNHTFAADRQPVYLPGELKDNPMIPVRAVLEMLLAEPVKR